MSEFNEPTPEESSTPENEDFTDIFDDLIRMLWNEKRARENPMYEKNLQTVTERVRYSLINHLREYIDSYLEQPDSSTAEGAMYWYMVKFKEDIETETNIFSLVIAINYWLQEVHQRMNQSFGGELLGFTEYDLEALNYIEPDKPIEQQKHIISEKVEQEYAKYGKENSVRFTF